MTIEKVKLAREFFKVKDYPGNLFNLITNDDDYISKYNLLLFKQDLGENSSGFISYIEDTLAIICINYKMNIGRQNFTLAHEIGHMFLHKGLATDDSAEIENDNSNHYEKEASDFAAEFLYPKDLVKVDYKYIISNKLMGSSANLKLADYVNEICKRNCISFKFAFYRIFKENGVPFYSINAKYDKIIKCVGKVSERYEKYNHMYIEDHDYYKPYVFPIQIMKKYINDLVKNYEISYETGQAILERNNELEGCK